MIRTLLVDDEHLVRKGLLHVLPWNKHGMEIVGEAGNGEEALQFLSSHTVDLLVTDLTMPIMSGFELMKEVKTLHPRLQTVILTCHQDFYYVQEALRLGAIDYIVKTQLEDHVLDEVLHRISGKVRLELIATHQKSSRSVDKGFLFLPRHSGVGMNELYRFQRSTAETIMSVSEEAWFLQPEWPGELQYEEEDWIRTIVPEADWLVVCFHELNGIKRQEMKETLTRYLDHGLFYAMKKGKWYYNESMREWTDRKMIDKGLWLKHWNTYRWVFESAAFDQLDSAIIQSKPSGKLLRDIIQAVLLGWSYLHFFHINTIQEAPSAKAGWEEWSDWLKGICQQLQAGFHNHSGSIDLVLGILQAMDTMRKRLKDGVTQEEISASVHMSRGYFSNCFKQITGIPFNDYMRKLRLDTARELLEHTSISVQEISESCGFLDDQYFRKVFKEETGKTPKEYRENKKK
ncbi:MAG: response regulator [Gorillibacterium sp.]|nr:response regulator [Gorillibacterium sp.]